MEHFQRKILYRCSALKARSDQCDSRLQIVCENANLFAVQLNGLRHTCDEKEAEEKTMTTLSTEVTERIQSLFRSGTRMPKAVLKVLREDFQRQEIDFDEEPTINQIRYQIEKYKKESFGGGEIKLGELETFLKKSTAVPKDQDEPFVLDYRVKFGKDDVFSDSDTSESDEESQPEQVNFHQKKYVHN